MHWDARKHAFDLEEYGEMITSLAWGFVQNVEPALSRIYMGASTIYVLGDRTMNDTAISLCLSVAVEDCPLPFQL